MKQDNRSPPNEGEEIQLLFRGAVFHSKQEFLSHGSGYLPFDQRRKEEGTEKK